MKAIDVAILAALKADGRISLTNLAEKVGISRPALRDRMARMEKKGQILGYTVLTSHETEKSLPDESQVKALLHLKFANSENDCFKLSAYLSSYKNVLASWGTTGNWDMIVLVKGGNMETISEIREIIKATGGLDRIETFVVLNEFKKSDFR